MLDRITATLDFQGQALRLRAHRQQVLSANIANADTPRYKARDFDFGAELRAAQGASGTDGNAPHWAAPTAGSAPRTLATSNARHLPGMVRGTDGSLTVSTLKYREPQQASLDGNTVDLDRERANFADNTVRYEASLRFINGNVRRILSAMRGE